MLILSKTFNNKLKLLKCFECLYDWNDDTICPGRRKFDADMQPTHLHKSCFDSN